MAKGSMAGGKNGSRMGKLLDVLPQQDASPEKKHGDDAGLRLLLFVFSIIATAAVLLLIFTFKSPIAPADEERIDVFLDGSTPFLTGQNATVRAFSSCGPFDLLFDQLEIAKGDVRAEARLAPAAGRHIIEAKNTRCASLLSFMVLEKECNAGEKRDCFVNGCPGTESCSNGFYNECALPKKICAPGEKIGCSTDGCKFGYTACNACGSGYGPCLPRGGSSDASGPCIGNACN